MREMQRRRGAEGAGAQKVQKAQRCRGAEVQKVSKMQKIIHGFDAGKFSDFLDECGAAKFFLVCDGAFEFLPIKDVFDGVGVPYVKFDSFSPNPIYEDVERGVRLFLECGADAIVAVGGGSSIDVAKCIKLFSAMDASRCYIGQEYKDSGVPLAAVPSTAGTGSESTRHAVIYYKGVKQSISHDSIVPDAAFLEPGVLKTLPLYQKKCTLLDALCQGIESFWSVNATDESEIYSEMAIRLICGSVDSYIFENSGSAASLVMEGANYSGRAINITQTTAPHAMSYKLSSLYSAPHGHAVAVCMPKVWRYMLQNTERCVGGDGGKGRLDRVFSRIAAAMGCDSPEGAVEKFEEILRKLEIENPAGKEEDIPLLCASVNPVRLKNNPVVLGEDTLCRMYREIVKI